MYVCAYMCTHMYSHIHGIDAAVRSPKFKDFICGFENSFFWNLILILSLK